MKRAVQFGLLSAGVSLVGFAPSVQAAPTPVLDYAASNYNPSTGVWVDTSGNADNAAIATGGAATALASGATPNGSSAVKFTGSELQDLTISTPLNDSGGFTVFVYEASNGNGASKAILSGTAGTGFEYRIGGDSNGEVQEVLVQHTANLGHSTTALGTDFHLIDVAVNSSGAAFRTDGANDGTAGGATFGTGAISLIGSANGDEPYVGEIAEIRVYAGKLSSDDIATVEAQLTAAYTPEPASAAVLGLGVVSLLARRRRAM